jgi:hypothetical protein
VTLRDITRYLKVTPAMIFARQYARA